MKKVLLEDGTVGESGEMIQVGDTTTVELHDENGSPVEVSGLVVEILS